MRSVVGGRNGMLWKVGQVVFTENDRLPDAVERDRGRNEIRGKVR